MTRRAADREIVATRVFDARRELVWKMWTDPNHIAQWWGPKGFTNTIHEMDVRPGGVWRFVMHGPDGVDYQNKIVFIEVVKSLETVHTSVDFRLKDSGVPTPGVPGGAAPLGWTRAARVGCRRGGKIDAIGYSNWSCLKKDALGRTHH